MSGYNKKNRNVNSDPQLRYIKNPNISSHENFARLYRSVVYSDAMIQLPHYCLRLYVLLVLECKGQSQNNTCVFPVSLWSKHFNEKTFKKARKLLEEKGFIDYTRSRSTKNTVYTLSDRWWKGEPGFQEPAIYHVTVSKK